MKLKTRSLRVNLLIYFLIFSSIILGFLYFFQIIFFNTYYKINQTNALEQTVSSIEKNISKDDADIIFDELSLDNEVCIQIISNKKTVYYSDFHKQCLSQDNNSLLQIKNGFIASEKKYLKVEFINTKYNNKSFCQKTSW